MGGRPRRLVQLEPIRTVAIRAANAVGSTAAAELSPDPSKRRSREDRRAIGVPLTPVTRGLTRSFADILRRRSGHTPARTAQIPKLVCEFCWLTAHGARWTAV